MSNTQQDGELCAKCGDTHAGHVSNTGVIYPCWTPSGRFKDTVTREDTVSETLDESINLGRLLLFLANTTAVTFPDAILALLDERDTLRAEVARLTINTGVGMKLSNAQRECINQLIDAARNFGYTQSNSSPLHEGYKRDKATVERARAALVTAITGEATDA